MTLLDRYCSGNCEHVWRQIVEERRPADDTDALEVAKETVLRARENLRTIHQRLVELGYEFEEPDCAFVPTTPEKAVEEISEIEAQYGRLPGLARIWYSHIHSVNFAQAKAQCRGSDHVLRNLGLYPQAIYLPLSRCRGLSMELHSKYVEWYHETRANESVDSSDTLNRCCKTPDESARFLPLGSGASNDEHKGFTLPCDLMDTEFFNDGESTCFNDDIRYVIMSGGFPRLGSKFYREKVPEFMRFGHPDPDSLLDFLTRDLLAI